MYSLSKVKTKKKGFVYCRIYFFLSTHSNTKLQWPPIQNAPDEALDKGNLWISPPSSFSRAESLPVPFPRGSGYRKGDPSATGLCSAWLLKMTAGQMSQNPFWVRSPTRAWWFPNSPPKLQSPVDTQLSTAQADLHPCRGAGPCSTPAYLVLLAMASDQVPWLSPFTLCPLAHRKSA